MGFGRGPGGAAGGTAGAVSAGARAMRRQQPRLVARSAPRRGCAQPRARNGEGNSGDEGEQSPMVVGHQISS
jgi:hypothetical protein